MTKEKVASLNRYLTRLQDKLTSPITTKHSGHPRTYKEFLQREIEMVKKKLEQAKIDGVK